MVGKLTAEDEAFIKTMQGDLDAPMPLEDRLPAMCSDAVRIEFLARVLQLNPDLEQQHKDSLINEILALSAALAGSFDPPLLQRTIKEVYETYYAAGDEHASKT